MVKLFADSNRLCQNCKRVFKEEMLLNGRCPKCQEHREARLAKITEFCVYCGAGIGKHRREGEGTCPWCHHKGKDWDGTLSPLETDDGDHGPDHDNRIL